MPKKSDRPQHESAMSSLLPEVDLDEEESEEASPAREGEQNDSSTELQNSSNTEEQNYSDSSSDSKRSRSKSRAQADSSSSSGSSPDDSRRASNSTQKNEDPDLSVLPSERPDLKKKLGPYVSEEIDDALEEAYLTLRRQFGGDASKSLIVEAALRYSLSDCLRRGEDSEIASWMERVLKSKD